MEHSYNPNNHLDNKQEHYSHLYYQMAFRAQVQELSDYYYLYLPFIGWNLEDYLVVETLKNTKEVVRIDLAKECFSEVKTSMILKKDKNISKIFK